MAKGKNYFNSAYTNNEINSDKKSRNLYDGGGGKQHIRFWICKKGIFFHKEQTLIENIKLLSGNVKYEGLHAGRRVLAHHLLSQNLGVTHNCQYKTIIKSRANREVPQNHITICDDPEAKADGLPGHLCHNLNLESVYGDLETPDVRNPVVSTNHGDWTIVDYIFFSRAVNTGPDDSKMHVTGQLYLNSRLLLPLASNMADIGRIPSKLCPSDHFPLLADFVLVPNS